MTPDDPNADFPHAPPPYNPAGWELVSPEPDPEPPGVEAAVVVTCWRCERTDVPDGGRCRFCLAKLTDAEDGDEFDEPTPPAASHAMNRVLVGYALMLALSVVWGWVLLAG